MAPASDLGQSIPLVDFRADFERYGKATTAAMTEVAQSGQFILGPQVAELESALSAYLQPDDTQPVVHTVGVSDGTSALQLCLMALGVGCGYEVVTTPFTWISSAEVIPLIGATAVFADVEADTYLLDVERVKEVLTPRTRAVIAVSLYGLVPDLRAIRAALDAAESRWDTRIALIEDGAQSFGAVRYGDKSCGSKYATMSTTSFFPTKPLGGYGDGGAVFTRNTELADCVRALRVHGKVAGKHMRVGLNSRLDSLQAAVLLAKWSAFPDMIRGRRVAARRYTHLLRDDQRVVVPSHDRVVGDDESASSAWGVYTVQVDQRDAVAKKMREAGVATAVYYPTPCHLQPMFRDRVGSPESDIPSLPVAERSSTLVLSLPMHPYLTEDVQTKVVNALRKALDDLKVTSRPS